MFFAGLIIAASSIPNLKGPQVLDFPFDKFAHFLEYALFSFLAYRSISHINKTMNQRKAVIITSLAVAGFAGLDEFYQKYVPGRTPDLMDLLIDILGAGLVLFLLWYRKKRVITADERG